MFYPPAGAWPAGKQRPSVGVQNSKAQQCRNAIHATFSLGGTFSRFFCGVCLAACSAGAADGSHDARRQAIGAIGNDNTCPCSARVHFRAGHHRRRWPGLCLHGTAAQQRQRGRSACVLTASIPNQAPSHGSRKRRRRRLVCAANRAGDDCVAARVRRQPRNPFPAAGQPAECAA